jgi:hypothetical protein
MKSTFRFITLLLCVELVLGPVSPGLSLLASAAYAQQSCPTRMQFDGNLNRCLTKDETAKVLNATANCNGDVDCIKRNAIQALDEKVAAGETPEVKSSSGFMSTIGNAAAVAGPLAVALGATARTSAKCQSASFWAMVGGSVAFIIGDNWANYQHRSRLDKIKEEWGKLVNPTDANGDKDKIREASSKAQSQAFEMLAKAEDSLAEAANFKKNTYMIAGLAFTASGVISGLEIIAENADASNTTRLANLCKATPAATSIRHHLPFPLPGMEAPGLYEYYVYGGKVPLLEHRFEANLDRSTDFTSLFVNRHAMTLAYSSPTIDYYEEMKVAFRDFETENRGAFELFKGFTVAVVSNLAPVSAAHADERSGGVDTNAAKVFRKHEGKGIDFTGLGLGAAAGAAAGYFAPQFVTPTTRTIFAGVMAGMSFLMMSHASSQAEASKKRAALLRKMKSEFDSASGAINTCKSEDRSDPAKPDCFCYTAENQRNSARSSSTVCKNLWAGRNLNETNYLASGGSNAPICITNQNKADAGCSCRQTNTCMKVSAGGISGVGSGTMSMLGASLQPLNQMANGSVSAGKVNAGALANQAAKLETLKKKVEAHPALSALRKKKDEASADLQNRLQRASSSLGVSGSGLLGSSSNGMPSNPGEAARALETELEPPTAPTTASGGNQSIGGGAAAQPQPENLFGLNAEEVAAQNSQVAEAMKQDLDYSGGGTDISSAQINIFQAITIRYHRTGMRRLFEEPAPASTAAAPSASAPVGQNK